MARINIKGGSSGINVQGGSQQTVGTPFTVDVKINNRATVGGVFGNQAKCSFKAEDGYKISGHLCDVTVDLIGPNGVEFSETEFDICAPIDGPLIPDPLIRFDVPAPEAGSYDIRATVDPVNDPPDSAKVTIDVEEVGDAPDAGNPGDNDGDGGGSGDGDGDGDGDEEKKSLTEIVIQNPVGSLVVGTGAALAIREAFSGDE